MTAGSPATDFAVAVLGEFVRRGVRHVVLSPGSRSQALALAAAEFERAGLVTLSVQLDERGAGFVALGAAVESGMPSLVITTSGTAVGNLLPSVLEAHHSGVPLVLLTADRPEELRGIGSNQTTHQLGMFGEFVRYARDVEAPSASGFEHGYPAELAASALSAALGHSGTPGHSGRPGPVQINLAFREPLSGPVDAAQIQALATELEGAGVAAPPAHEVTREPIEARPGTVVIAGHGAGAQAEAAARALGAPLFAEVSSGAHFGPHLVVAYRTLLNDEQFAGGVDRAIVFGHPTLSREVPRLLERDGVEVIVVRGSMAEDFNPGHRVSRFVNALALPEETARPAARWADQRGAGHDGAEHDGSGHDGADEARSEGVGAEGARAEGAGAHTDTHSWVGAWVGSWVAASRALLDPGVRSDPAEARTDDSRAVAAFTRSQLAVFREPVTRRMLVETVWQKTWPHDRLVFGSSRLIREADRVVPGKRITVHANRGLAGIDGTIATARGIALGTLHSQPRTGGEFGAARAGTTRLLLGDLAFLHDVGSLLLAPGETMPRMQLIVGNDGGGTIFDSLEVAATAPSDAFDRVLYTPQSVGIAALAEAYGWECLKVQNRGELDEALTAASDRLIIEVPLPRE